MSPSSNSVRLQILVRKQTRNAEGLASLEAALRRLGFEVTGTGKASISVRAAPEVLESVFGGARQLRVPAALGEYVESISVAPPHTVISRRNR